MAKTLLCNTFRLSCKLSCMITAMYKSPIHILYIHDLRNIILLVLLLYTTLMTRVKLKTKHYSFYQKKTFTFKPKFIRDMTLWPQHVLYIKLFIVAFVKIIEPFQLRHNKNTNQCRRQSIGPNVCPSR